MDSLESWRKCFGNEHEHVVEVHSQPICRPQNVGEQTETIKVVLWIKYIDANGEWNGPMFCNELRWFFIACNGLFDWGKGNAIQGWSLNNSMRWNVWFVRLMQPTTPAIPSNVMPKHYACSFIAEQTEEQQKKILADAPLCSILTSGRNVRQVGAWIGELAKIICQKWCGHGRKTPFRWLREKWLLVPIRWKIQPTDPKKQCKWVYLRLRKRQYSCQMVKPSFPTPTPPR